MREHAGLDRQQARVGGCQRVRQHDRYGREWKQQRERAFERSTRIAEQPDQADKPENQRQYVVEAEVNALLRVDGAEHPEAVRKYRDDAQCEEAPARWLGMVATEQMAALIGRGSQITHDCNNTDDSVDHLAR